MSKRKIDQARDAALVTFNQAVLDGADRETINRLSAEYYQLKTAAKRPRPRPMADAASNESEA